MYHTRDLLRAGAALRRPSGLVAGALSVLALLGCGSSGGGSASGAGGDPPAGPPPPAVGTPAPNDEARASAARQTAESAGNACAAIGPFYWEIGNRSAALASGSVMQANHPASYDATTVMAIGSASKWIYGAYVVQKRGGTPSEADIRFLTMRSGYTSFTECLPTQSVGSCATYRSNGLYSAATDGLFAYGGGHMQHHAAETMGLASLSNAGLRQEIQSQLGGGAEFSYFQPQLAGGIATSAADYAQFLRGMLDGRLLLGSMLGRHAVCTNPATCPQARSTPIPTSESWGYDLGYWVESDPVVGDDSFSSAGTFGFYPWIDATRAYYGIVARRADANGEGYNSARCGRLIRKAWLNGAVSG